MIITTFKSIYKAYVDEVVNEDWNTLAQFLLCHRSANKKQDVPLYNFAEFVNLSDITNTTEQWGRKYHYVDGIKQDTFDLIPNTVRRCKHNVVGINGIVLDVDEKMTIDDIKKILDGIEYVLYTTFRHTKEKHKFRVTIPFTRMLLANDIEGRKQNIIDTFPGVDNASFTVSQSFYFHSGNNDSYTYWNRGHMIDPYEFKYTEPEIYVPTYHEVIDFSDEQLNQYRERVVESLMSCSNLHYAGTGDNNKGVLVLVNICKSIGLTYNEFDHICKTICASDSQLTKQHVRAGVWNSWKGDRIRAETRDRFIKEYNGRPIRKETPTTDYYDFKKKLEQKYGLRK